MIPADLSVRHGFVRSSWPFPQNRRQKLHQVVPADSGGERSFSSASRARDRRGLDKRLAFEAGRAGGAAPRGLKVRSLTGPFLDGGFDEGIDGPRRRPFSRCDVRLLSGRHPLRFFLARIVREPQLNPECGRA